MPGSIRRSAQDDATRSQGSCRRPVSPGYEQRYLPSTRREPSMWYIFGLALAVIVAAAFVLSRRPNRRTTIVIERD